MAYPRQRAVVERLTLEQKQLVRKHAEEPSARMFLAAWLAARRDVTTFARGLWHEAPAGQMDLQSYRVLGIRHRLQSYIEHRITVQFRREAVGLLDRFSRVAYRWQFLTSHWILDQVTPPNVRVFPRRDPDAYKHVGRDRPSVRKREKAFSKVRAAREAITDPPEGTPDVDAATGEPIASAEHYLDAYLKGWGLSALSAADMAVAGEATSADLAVKLAAARVGNRKVEDVLKAMISSVVQISVDDAVDDTAEDWGDVIEEEVWLTKGDARVCPDCDELEGMTRDEVESEYPDAEPGTLHPLCRCRYALMPKGFQELAGEDKVKGVADDSMVIRDPETGRRMATLSVDFPAWTGEWTRQSGQ